MLEYASIRLTDSWRPATRFATVIVTAARPAMTGGQPLAHDVQAGSPNDTRSTRKRMAKAAALTATAMNVVAGEGVACGGKDHCAQGGEEQKTVEFPSLNAVLGHVPAREQRRDRAAEAEQNVEEQREPVDEQPRRKRRDVLDLLHPVHPHGGRERGPRKEDGCGAEREPGAAGRERPRPPPPPDAGAAPPQPRTT